MNAHSIRQVTLDTETTGMNKFGVHYEGHRIIEIGAVEIIDRKLTGNTFHTYLNPHRSIDIEAFQVHGINNQFLLNKPTFSNILDKLLIFINGSELIIHNASFDLGFLNYELKYAQSNCKKIESCCTIIDSLKIARRMFPGQRNSLDALCERYSINNSKRILHNALLDAQILAHVFLCMTGGQIKIDFMETLHMNDSLKFITNHMSQSICNKKKLVDNINMRKPLRVIYANTKEKLEHEKYLDYLEESNQHCLWRKGEVN